MDKDIQEIKLFVKLKLNNMKTIILEIKFDDTDGYKGHGENTAELIIETLKNEMEMGMEADGVIKKGWTVKLVETEK